MRLFLSTRTVLQSRVVRILQSVVMLVVTVMLAIGGYAHLHRAFVSPSKHTIPFLARLSTATIYFLMSVWFLMHVNVDLPPTAFVTMMLVSSLMTPSALERVETTE